MSDWIEWHGGECPIRNGEVVEVKKRYGGTELFQQQHHYCYQLWTHYGDGLDIIAYRIVKPSETITPRNAGTVPLSAPSPDLIQWAVRQHSCAVSCILAGVGVV